LRLRVGAWAVGLTAAAMISLLAFTSVAAATGPAASTSVPDAPTTARAAVLTVTDDTGRRVTFPHPPLRIVSLAPGATEMLFAAGAGDRLIATVDFSDEPAAAKRVPRIGDVTAVDMERLVALHPDVVVVWPGGGNPAQIEKIVQSGIPVYRQQVNRLADLPASLRRLGALTADSAVAEQAARTVSAELARIAQDYGGRGGHSADVAAAGAPPTVAPPTVLLEVWNRPLYTVGGTQLMSDALISCGVRNVFGDLKELSPVIDTEAVIARNPDIIVAAAPPGEGASWLAEWRRFGSLSAVRAGRLLAFEDQRLSRLGPSVVIATEALCKALAATEVSRGSD
jgi:iron complex transport system substrate-binding protein